MSRLLKQSTAITLRYGPFVDSTDGVTPETGLTISQADVRLSKAGGAFAQKNDATAGTHDENGWYSLPLNTTDTGTLGSLTVAVNESGALPVWEHFMVVPANVFDSLVSGSDKLDTGVAESVTGAVGSVTAAVTTDSASRTASQADVSDIPTNAEFAARTLLAADYFDPAVDEVITDAASRTASKADVSNLDVAVSTRSSHSAADVWAVTTRTLSSFGTLIADIWANITRTLTAGTKDTEIDTIKAVTDVIPDSGAMTSIAQESTLGTVQTSVSNLNDFDPAVDVVAHVTLVDTTTTNTDMRGTENGATEAKQDIIDANVDLILEDTDTTIPAQITALNNISPAEVNAEVVDALNVDTYAEPGQGAPAATASIVTKLGYLYKTWRNKKTETATETAIYNDAGTVVDQKRTVSDDSTTATAEEFVTGP